MPRHVCDFRIVHARSLQGLVAPGKAARLDNIHGYAEAGGEAHDRPDISRLIRLIEGDAHGPAIARVARASKWLLANRVWRGYQAQQDRKSTRLNSSH